MNTTLKTVLLTILTLSAFTIAIIELSGVSTRALYNKYGIGNPPSHGSDYEERTAREERMKKMPKTNIHLIDEKHDFGKLKEGEIVSHTFKFKNIGEYPLFISDVQASCGCTVPKFSREPVMPGDDGTITLEFNTQGRKGKNHKSAIIYSNANREKVSVSFDAEVE